MVNPKYRFVGKASDRIVEEVGEILKELGKCKRFGLGGHHPKSPEVTNIEKLDREYSDLGLAIKDFKASGE